MPPNFDGLPTRFTEGLDSGGRSAPHAVHVGTTPR